MNRSASLLLLITLPFAACVSTPEFKPSAELNVRTSETKTTIVGYSLNAQPIELRRYGWGPTRVLIIGLIHGDESEAYDKFDELWECLQRREYAGRLTLEAIPNMNPDGLAIGSRFNADGVDLNRNWPASNFAPHRRRGHAPLSEPETRAVHRVIDERSPDLIVVFHSASSGPFVDPDGPGEAAAEAFVEGARRTDPRWRVHADFTNPAGSLGSYAGLDLGIPTLTIEFRRGQSSDSAHEAAKSGLRVLFENLVNSNR